MGCCSCSDEVLNVTAVAVVTAAISQVHHLATAADNQQDK
jgi:hypothetical protein